MVADNCFLPNKINKKKKVYSNNPVTIRNSYKHEFYEKNKKNLDVNHNSRNVYQQITVDSRIKQV